jgi:predicted aspartyl protease
LFSAAAGRMADPMIVSVLAAVLALAEPELPPPPPKIPPASIDETLEVTGEDLKARELRSRLFIDVLVDNKGPFRFVVDTGADRSVIGSGLAAQLKLPAEEPVQLRGIIGNGQVPTVLIETLTLGSSVIDTIVAPSLPEKFLGAQGIVGIDALSEQRVRLDFDAKTVTIQDSRVPAPREQGEIVVTARRQRGQLILTQASVDGRRTYAVIDTGLELSLGNLAMLRELRRGRGAVPLQTITMQSVTGETFTARLTLLPELKVGGITLKNVNVAFTDAPPFDLFGLDKQPALLLGTDVLQVFKRLSLDFKNRKVRFTLRN